MLSHEPSGLGCKAVSAGSGSLSLTLGTTGAGAATLLFDLATFGGTGTSVMDVSAGTLTTNAATYNVTVAADLNFLNTGTIALLKYATGAFTNAVVGTPPAGVVGTITNNLAANQVEMIVTSVSRNLTWVGDLSPAWNIASTANWVETGTTNPTTYKEIGLGDNVRFDDTASNYTVNVAAPVSPASIGFFGTNNYTVGGAAINGPAQVNVNVAQTASVTLTGNNGYTNGTLFNAGTTIVSSDANLGAPSGGMIWDGGVLRFTGSATNTRAVSVQNAANPALLVIDTNQIVQLGGTYDRPSGNAALYKEGPGSLVLTGSGNLRLFVDEGTATLAGSASVTNGAQYHNISSTNGTARLIVKDNARLESTAPFDIADGNNQTNAIILGELYVQDNATLSLTELYLGKYLNATGRVYQTGGLVTNNNPAAGNWYIGGNVTGDTNGFGGYYLSGGTLAVTGRSLVVGRTGTGELVVSGTGSLQGQGLNVADQTNSLGSMVVNGATVSLSANLNVPLNGQTATLVVSNNAVVTAGGLVLGSANAGSGTASGTRAITFNSGTLRATAGSTTFMQGLTTATIGSGGLTVDTDTNNITINQAFTGTGGLTKTGNGKLTLPAGSAGFGGPVVVNAGTLAGGLIGTPLQFTGNLTVNAGGTVAPGSSLGQIASVGAVTVSGSAAMEIKKGLFANSSDAILAAGSLTFSGGTVNVTFEETSDTPVTVGDTFTLFNKAVGGSYTLNPPMVDPVNGNLLTWTDNLGSSGQIVVDTVTPAIVTDPPPVLTNMVVGANFQLSWGSEYEGYTLQQQTNGLDVGLSTNWEDIVGSESLTATNIPVDVLVPSTFFRLIYTP